ncbi:hypothetical protein MTR67_048204 [Solanum verrucosum]|uniref:Uncharacterized protein n=1 Tax=Solanum verrucosum TaxID=315347 RepID=A0AAF0UZZ6_SOLVR|nr:hypothetical protein MTR67_048204 [Solanum verrucosum]
MIIFSSRPALTAGKYISFNHSDVSWAPYGAHWRQARKIYQTEIFSPKRLESFKYIRVEERRNLISRLHVLSGMLDEWFTLGGVINIGDWIPWLNWLDLQGYIKRMKALNKKLREFFKYVLEDHKAKGKEDSVPKDMVDVLLQLVDDPNLEVKITTDNLMGLILDLLVGGTDTSATTVEWTFQELVRNPKMIEKANEELDRRCPGYNFGIKLVGTTLANLLHGFNWRLTGGIKPEEISMKEIYGLTTHPEKPIFIMEPRRPLHLY